MDRGQSIFADWAPCCRRPCPVTRNSHRDTSCHTAHPQKASSRHAQSASNSAMRHACSVGCEALALVLTGVSPAYGRARITNYHHSLRFASAVCPHCLPHRVSGLPTTFPRTPVHRPRQRYHPQPLSSLVHPLSLELAWPPSWRSCSVAQGPGHPASCGLTCGRKFLDSIKFFRIKLPCHSLLLVLFQSSLPHALASLPCPLC